MRRLKIKDLWEYHDQEAWRDALDRYWVNPTVIRNLEIEQLMDRADIGTIRNLGSREWYDFLEKYFRWKFTGNYLDDRLRDLAKNSLDHLASVKRSLVAAALDEFELADIRKCLKLVKSPQIKGLGYPGASGLLAILFKQWYGTVDRMVVESLCEIDLLPERQRIHEIDAWLKSKREWEPRDAALLVDIMRRKAAQLNAWFDTDTWTPRKVDMVLWTFRDGGLCAG
jgi:hypothetical protein